jgi:hypothetical protein
VTLKTTRFMRASGNRTLSSTVLINGGSAVTYPGRPDKSEDTQYPMTNLALNDRYSPWRAASSLTGNYDVEWDLGADVVVDVIGLHGFRWASGQISPTSFSVTYRTAALGYSQAGTWAALKTGALIEAQANGEATRDIGWQLDSPKRLRYLRFRFGAGATGGGFSVGNFVIGQVTDDLGVLYSPGAIFRPQRAVARAQTMTGGTTRRILGDERSVIELPYQNVQSELLEILKNISRQTEPFTYLSPEDEFRQAIPAADEFEYEHVFGSAAPIWNLTLRLELLG